MASRVRIPLGHGNLELMAIAEPRLAGSAPRPENGPRAAAHRARDPEPER
jgi:hypothetical protein